MLQVWNSIGIVYSFESEDEQSIDIEFHDTSFHHTIHMNNMYNYSMADLSSACLLLASRGGDSADDLDLLKSRLYVQMFNTWDNVKEWHVDVGGGDQGEEIIECVCAGTNFVAAATSLHYLRIWTVGGIQTSLVSLAGSPVNLSAYERFVMILFHSASGYSHGQSISCQALKIDHKGKTRCHPIPKPISVALSPVSTVYWAGFTDEGTPCIADSDGVIRVYKKHLGEGWFPICSTKVHVSLLVHLMSLNILIKLLRVTENRIIFSSLV